MSSIVVVFDDAWITPVDDPSVSVHATYPERGRNTARAGEIRQYAGGRTKVITTAARTATFALTLQLLTDADVDLLESWQGRLLLLRDGSGRREVGTILACDVTDYYDADGTLHNVTLNLTAVTYDESV